MNKVSIAIVLAVVALALSADAHQQVREKRQSVKIGQTSEYDSWTCQWLASLGWQLSSCETETSTTRSTKRTTAPTSVSTKRTTAPTSVSTKRSTSTDAELFQSSASTFELETSTSASRPMENKPNSSSTLERSHWCRFTNGSYIPLGYTFMHTACAVCQCTQNHAIRCSTLQCMTTYCIDNSTPMRRQDQCCPQCRYENQSSTCAYNGVTYPHGTVVKSGEGQMTCWCQLGSIECRKSSASLMSGLNLLGDGSAIYVVIIIIGVILIVGTLLCGACALLFYYYYYQRQQQAGQQAYNEYWNQTGWQPMGEDEQAVDADAAAKKAEAEQGQAADAYPTGSSEEYIPPPYVVSSGSYTADKQEQAPRYI